MGASPYGITICHIEKCKQSITSEVSIMNKNSVISIDLAKNVFQVYLLNPHNQITINKKVRRSKLLETVLNLDGGVI
jgi:hypothetical protein